MEKTVAISERTWKALKQLQLDLSFSTMDDVISMLITVRETAEMRARER